MDTDVCLDQILADTEGLAAAAEGNLGADVPSCPGWDVADLVAHVIDVHWTWEYIARVKPQTRPDDVEGPERVPDDQLITTLRTGVRRMVDTLRSADQTEPVWTWAGPDHQNIAFITRHQVQEAAVHRWDAENAAGQYFSIDPPAAADAVDEFLEVSLAQPDGGAPPLGGTLVLSATDTGDAWTVTDQVDGHTVRVDRGRVEDAAAALVEAPASDLLLWLYRRRELDVSDGEDREVVGRFVRLTETD